VGGDANFPAYGSGNTLLFGGAVGAVVVYVLAAAIIAFVIGRPLIRLSYLNELRARRSVDWRRDRGFRGRRPFVSGEVLLPSGRQQALFVPQLPYLSLGDLRTVASYPVQKRRRGRPGDPGGAGRGT
jgi:ABC-type uncharacterized transport system fused permease/ATPase subunit